jgi:hypothetical protein
MKDVSGPTLRALQQLRKQSVLVADLCDSIILGGDTNRHNAMRLIHAALLQLQVRIEAELETLESGGTP